MRNKANIIIEQIFDNILENRTTVCYNEKNEGEHGEDSRAFASGEESEGRCGMVLNESLSIEQKLEILSDAAKYVAIPIALNFVKKISKGLISVKFGLLLLFPHF